LWISKAAVRAPRFLSGKDSGRMPLHSLKSVRYSQTMPIIGKSHESLSIDSPKTSLRDAKSVRSSSSMRSSYSYGVRTVASKSSLASTLGRGRPASLGLSAHHTSVETFETWDTSTVDAHSKAVIEASSPGHTKTRFLETIPASPTISRSSTPGSISDMSDLQPPRAVARRSRSTSPASYRIELAEHDLSPPDPSELNIHPLFRSHSPTPPPTATPGTSVVAAPDAVRIVTPRQSIRSLNRMRSSSLPTAPSPLSRQGSFEDTKTRKLKEDCESIRELEEERHMTPPIPEWVITGAEKV
jgi:hypothetical protein